MAENKTRGQGFDRHWFVKKERALQFQCGVCSNVLKDPYQIVKCGHHACRDCLSRDLKDVRECPVCNVEIKDFKTEIFPDTSVKIKVFGLLMKCPDKKCKWKGELRQFLEKHENECPFGVLKCPNEKCNERVTREDLKKHLETCPYREIKCPHCGRILYFKDEKRHLEEQCLKIPVDCAQGCGKQIIKEQIQDHIDNECENTLIDCKYKDLGCDELVERGNIEDHESSNVALHLAKAVDVIRNLKEEKRALTEKLRKFDEKHESLDRKMTDSIQTQKTHSNKIESDLKEFVKMGSLSLENVKKATEQNFENNERNGIELEEQRNELQHLNDNIIPILKNDITINEDEIIKLIGTTNDLKNFTVAIYNELKHEHDDQRQVMEATINTLRHDLVIEKTERVKNENKTGEHLTKVNANIGNNIKKLKQMQGEILVSQDATKEKFSQQYKQIQSNYENLLEMIKKEKKLTDHKFMRLTNDRTTLIRKRTGVSLWQIEHDVNLKSSSDCVTGETFYSEEYGYLVQPKLYYNGAREEDSGYISVFIQLLQGPYDAILQWPFNKHVRFTLFAQECKGTGKNIQKILIPQTDVEEFQRPPEKGNMGFGLYKFASHEILQSGSYVVNDTMFLKIEILTNNEHFETI